MSFDAVRSYLDGLYEVLHEAKPKVRIPVEKGDLGLTLDDPIEKYQEKLEKGEKSWAEMSRQINALVIFNKNKHPDIAKKWRSIRERLAKWVEKKREEDPNFAT